MRTNTLIAGALALGSFAAAQDLDAAALEPRHGPDDDKHPIVERKAHGLDDDKHPILAREAHGPHDDKHSIAPREAHGPDDDKHPVVQEVYISTKIIARAPTFATTTDPTDPNRPIPSYDPIKISKLQSDMHSLHTKIRADPLYTSMTKALKTAIPESYRQAMLTNPASVHSEYHTAPPEWYRQLPSDIRGFMEKNQKDAKSIWSKDMGPIPTGKNKDSKAKDDGKANEDGKKSDAPGLSLVGAAVAALVGAVGVAVLLM